MDPEGIVTLVTVDAPRETSGLRGIRAVEHGSSIDATRGDAVAGLVLAASAGDKQAWDELVDRFAGTVWAVARAHRLNAADAADVSQTTWMRLVENLDRIQQPERIRAWLVTTARRECLRLLRLSARQVPSGDDMDMIPDAPVEPMEHRVVVDERADLVAGLVSQLSPRSQTLLRLLSDETPFSYKEISRLLGMPIGSIGPTRARALEQLKRLALKEGLDPEDILP